ncbi:MAG: hypothetical protein IRZ00_02165 [Gemmatimonadetes bacterium]|nr:hypothetical protein [Gemmatimonadota bacterium]
MDVICLSSADYRLLTTRYAEHGNSQRRLTGALLEAGALDALERARALRRLERHFGIDLGMVCHRFEHRNDAATHPIERSIMSYVAAWRGTPGGARELWVLPDRIRQLRELMNEGAPARSAAARRADDAAEPPADPDLSF